MIGFKTRACKKYEKTFIILMWYRLRHKTGLHVVGFGATAKNHFQAAQCVIFGLFYFRPP